MKCADFYEKGLNLGEKGSKYDIVTIPRVYDCKKRPINMFDIDTWFTSKIEFSLRNYGYFYISISGKTKG